MQPKNNTSAIERVDALIAHIGISQAAFARRCGVEPSNLNKRLSGEVKFTDNYFAKIAHAFNVNFEWLRNGIGEMFTEEKKQSARRSSPPSIRCSTQIQALCRKILSAAITIKARRR